MDITIYRQVESQGDAVLERRSPKGIMPATENGGYGVPLGIVLPTSEINFEGGNIACPKSPNAYLRLLYGDFEQIEYTYVNPVAAKKRSLAVINK